MVIANAGWVDMPKDNVFITINQSINLSVFLSANYYIAILIKSLGINASRRDFLRRSHL